MKKMQIDRLALHPHTLPQSERRLHSIPEIAIGRQSMGGCLEKGTISRGRQGGGATEEGCAVGAVVPCGHLDWQFSPETKKHQQQANIETRPSNGKGRDCDSWRLVGRRGSRKRRPPGPKRRLVAFASPRTPLKGMTWSLTGAPSQT